MEKYSENRQTVFHEDIPKSEDLSLEEKKALRGLLLLKDTKVEKEEATDWITSKKCKTRRTKK